MHTCKLLGVTTWLWESSLAPSRKIPMPTTISLTEHHVSWSVLWVQCCSLILASVDMILPRADVVRMWWVLWRLQTSCRTTCQTCIYAQRSHPDSSSRSSNTVVGVSQGNIIFAMVRIRFENVIPPPPLTVLLAGSWLNLLKLHLHPRPLAFIPHAHYSNQQVKKGLWRLCRGPTMGTSDCFLPPSSLLPSPAFKSLSSSSLAPIHEMSTSIWQIMG